MPKLQTLTDLANKALTSIGQDPIESIEETDEKSTICRLWIYDAIEYCLHKFNWQEMLTTATLEQDSEDSAEGLARWRLPSNFLHLHKVITGVATVWTLESDFLVMDTETQPIIQFIPYGENVSQYGYNLYRCIYTRHAQLIAPAITQDEFLIQKSERDARIAWSEETGNAVSTRRSSARKGRGNSWQRSRNGSKWHGPNKEIMAE